MEALFYQYTKYEFGKFFWPKYYPDYPLPSVEQRLQELDHTLYKLRLSLEDNTYNFALGKIDLVDFVSPFLKLLMDTATFKARVDIAINRERVPEENIASLWHGPNLRMTELKNQELLQETIRQKDQRIHELLNSWSWKITAPLRRLCDLFRSNSSRH